jgi:hypothetical protein
MAARENQGLQIALIIFVMLTIVLIVATYMFFSSSQAEKEKNKTLVADNSNKDKTARDAVAESEALKNMIGATLTEKADAILAKTKKDMETHSQGIPEANQNYRALVEHLATELGKYKAGNSELTAHAKELADKIKTNDDAEKAEIAKYTATITETAADLEKRRKEFGQDRQGIVDQQTGLATKYAADRKAREELTKKASAEAAALTAENSKLSSLLQNKNDEELRKDKANEVADGKITWVDQRARLVWINVGSADGLRRQTSFSVFSVDDSVAVDPNHKGKIGKGKIEVVRLIDRHLAEARIVEDDLSDPVLPGDQIFSLTWEAGRAEHFALAGKMDIDHDGESDRQRIHELITLNGGVIDEEISDDNKKTGRMSINTKYLVLGDPPTDEGKIKYYSDIRSEAQTLGVKVIPVSAFLDYMGYKAEDRTVNLGRNANPDDFKPRLPDGRQRVLPGSATPKDLRKSAPSTKAS